MTSMLETFMTSHPAVTLSYADYGQHFYLGKGVSIPVTPPQRLRSFVENDGSSGDSAYRFFVIGRLASFKVVEDTVRAFWTRSLNGMLT
jgi:hypothetical protein